MLKLKKVQILGFKSFCDRTEVQLTGNGIAAIVGPNGCGKSNISDAITWVLGEQSAKSLRGIKMEDVIFAGTRERKPTGMAEVSLTLVDPEIYDSQSSDPDDFEGQSPTPISTDWNEAELREQRAAETEEAVAEAQPGTVIEHEADPAANETEAQNVVLKIRRRKFGRAPIRAGELTVTRRLFRSGDSEYLLNGKICRLRDIQDIFMGTGLGGESYAIIGQERIGQLLSSKPADRRGIIEEAAGITRFKTKNASPNSASNPPARTSPASTTSSKKSPSRWASSSARPPRPSATPRSATNSAPASASSSPAASPSSTPTRRTNHEHRRPRPNHRHPGNLARVHGRTAHRGSPPRLHP